MKRSICIIAMNLLLLSCAIDRSISTLTIDEQNTLQTFLELPAENRLKVTEDIEPGEKLKLCITLVDKKNKHLLENQKIHFFQTDNNGDYQPKVANDESSARISGTITTESKGRVFLETILPGDYGSSEDNRHIHTTIFGAKPEGYDINFKQYTSFMLNNFIKGSDQHFLADLRRDKDGILIAFLTLEPKFP